MEKSMYIPIYRGVNAHCGRPIIIGGGSQSISGDAIGVTFGIKGG